MFTESLADFFGTADFATSGTFTPTTGSASTVKVIFDEAYSEQFGIAGTNPAVLGKASDFGESVTVGGTLLLNSVKVTPADEDVDAVLQAASTLEHMLANLDAVSTLPPAAREQLRGLVRVVPFLSGSNFSARVEAVCRADGVGTSRPDGEGFAVTLPAL